LVRVLARAAVLGDRARSIASADPRVVERRELTEVAVAGEQGDQQVGDEADDPERAAAQRERGARAGGLGRR
jgi:hypothetical protein